MARRNNSQVGCSSCMTAYSALASGAHLPGVATPWAYAGYGNGLSYSAAPPASFGQTRDVAPLARRGVFAPTPLAAAAASRVPGWIEPGSLEPERRVCTSTARMQTPCVAIVVAPSGVWAHSMPDSREQTRIQLLTPGSLVQVTDKVSVRTPTPSSATAPLLTNTGWVKIRLAVRRSFRPKYYASRAAPLLPSPEDWTKEAPFVMEDAYLCNDCPELNAVGAPIWCALKQLGQLLVGESLQ